MMNAPHMSRHLPKIFLVSIVLLSLISWNIAGIMYFFPMIDMMVIFYWSIYKPHLLPSWFLFLMGFFKDALSGGALGVSALMYIMLQMTVIRLRGRYVGEDFSVLWIGFTLFAIGIAFLQWVLCSFVIGQFLAIRMAFMQLVLSVVVYPFFHYTLNKLHVMMPGGLTDVK